MCEEEVFKAIGWTLLAVIALVSVGYLSFVAGEMHALRDRPWKGERE